jgi:hypothetical protein
LACLAQHAEVRELRRGEAVRQQHGEEAAALIVVLRGEVVAWLPAAEGSEGAGARRGGGGSGSGGGSGGGGSGSGVGGGGGEAALCRFGAGERCSGFLELLEALVEGLRLSEAAAPAAAPGPSTSAAVEVAETLGAMGFVDAEIVQYVVEKNGPDLDACVRDLTTLNENEQGLRDLAEMGFPDTKLNAKLLIKNGGSVKNCVRDLVADM